MNAFDVSLGFCNDGFYICCSKQSVAVVIFPGRKAATCRKRFWFLFAETLVDACFWIIIRQNGILVLTETGAVQRPRTWRYSTLEMFGTQNGNWTDVAVSNDIYIDILDDVSLALSSAVVVFTSVNLSCYYYVDLSLNWETLLSWWWNYSFCGNTFVFVRDDWESSCSFAIKHLNNL